MKTATPLVATDALLFDTTLSPDEKIVLAATLGFPNRNPSQTQTAEATGLHRLTVIEAQKKLNVHHPDILFIPDGPLIVFGTDKVDELWLTLGRDHLDRPIQVPPPAAVWDRPAQNSKNAHDRTPNRLIDVWEKFDPQHPSNVRQRIELPASIHTTLAKGKGVKNASLVRLVALALAREQLLRGAIQISAETLASMIDADPRAVKRITTRFLHDGVLRVHQDGNEPVYVMPGATDASPMTPDDFDPARTKTMVTLQFDEGEECPHGCVHSALWFDVLTTDAGLALIFREVRELGDKVAAHFLELDPSVKDHQHGWNTTETILLSLRRAATELATNDTAYLKKTPCVSQEDPVPVTRRPPLLPTTDYPIKPSRAAADEHDQPEPSQATGDGEVAQTGRARQSKPTRRKYPDRFGTFVFADDATEAALSRYVAAIETKYGHNEGANFFRTACLEWGPLGTEVLRGLRAMLPHLDPDVSTDTAFLDAILGDEEAA